MKSRIWLIILAAVIVGISIIFTNHLAGAIVVHVVRAEDGLVVVRTERVEAFQVEVELGRDVAEVAGAYLFMRFEPCTHLGAQVFHELLGEGVEQEQEGRDQAQTGQTVQTLVEDISQCFHCRSSLFCGGGILGVVCLDHVVDGLQLGIAGQDLLMQGHNSLLEGSGVGVNKLNTLLIQSLVLSLFNSTFPRFTLDGVDDLEAFVKDLYVGVLGGW